MSTLEQLTQLRTLAEQKINEASNQQAIDELCRSYNKLNWDILHVGKGF